MSVGVSESPPSEGVSEKLSFNGEDEEKDPAREREAPPPLGVDFADPSFVPLGPILAQSMVVVEDEEELCACELSRLSARSNSNIRLGPSWGTYPVDRYLGYHGVCGLGTHPNFLGEIISPVVLHVFLSEIKHFCQTRIH